MIEPNINDIFQEILRYIFIFKSFLSIYFVVPLIFIVGIYLSFRLKFLQFTKLKYAWNALLNKDSDSEGNDDNLSNVKKVSSFAALSAVLGGNLGTGNIAGIAVGLSLGGPGALFWMWIMAFLGSVIKFAGCYLGVKYRVEDERAEGGTVGGPMYYISNGLNFNFAAKIFCIVAILAGITAGNMVQVNSITLPLTSFGISPYASGAFMVLAVSLVLFKGKKMFLEVASKIVPIMAIVYIISCFVIIIVFAANLIPVIKTIMQAAFSPFAAVSGVGGYMVLDAMNRGFDRGLFATDAGNGLAPILHAEVTGNPKDSLEKQAFIQGMVGVVAPIIVMLICTLTGITLLVTGVWNQGGLESTNMCIKAFELGFGGASWAGSIVMITLWFFAFTTILTWAHCAEKAYHFVFPNLPTIIYRIMYIAFIPLGSFISVSGVWFAADIAINLMLIINVIGVVGLSSKVIKETKVFLK